MKTPLYIKENTKCGYKKAYVGDSIDLGFSGSNTRRGRVGRDVAHTIATGCLQGVVAEDGRIRKFTPKEYWRLQGMPDDAFNKAASVGIPETQLYKQAGNGVTVNVVYEIAKKLEILD